MRTAELELARGLLTPDRLRQTPGKGGEQAGGAGVRVVSVRPAHHGIELCGIASRLEQPHKRSRTSVAREDRIDQALWDLELALSLNPRFTEADRLREHLSGLSQSEPDNSVIRNLLRDIVREQVKPPESHDTSESKWN